MGCAGSKPDESASTTATGGKPSTALLGANTEDTSRASNMRKSVLHRSPEFEEFDAINDSPFDTERIGTLTKHGIAPARSGAGQISKAKINQDRGVVCWPFNGSYNQALLAVFDGHGVSGERLSEWCTSEIISRLEADRENLKADPKSCIEKTVIKMDQELLKDPVLGSCARSAGTTSNVLYFHGTEVFTGCSGDSRAVLGRRRKGKIEAFDLSRDHKPDLPDERRRIERAGGVVSAAGPRGLPPSRVWVNGRVGLAMSRSIGDGEAKTHGVVPDPEVTCNTISPADSPGADGDLFVIVASDGIWEFISSKQARACEIAAKHSHATEACKALVKLAEQRWQEEEGSYRDDITCIIAKLPFLEGSDSDEAPLTAGPGDITLETKSDAYGDVDEDDDGNGGSGGGKAGVKDGDAESFAKRRLSVAAPFTFDA